MGQELLRCGRELLGWGKVIITVLENTQRFKIVLKMLLKRLNVIKRLLLGWDEELLEWSEELLGLDEELLGWSYVLKSMWEPNLDKKHVTKCVLSHTGKSAKS